MAEPKAHQLYKQVPGTLFTWGGSPGASTVTNGWEEVGDGSVGYAIYRSYIDLSGWSKQEVTTFTQGVDIQKGIMPLLGGPAGATGLREFDFITTRRLTDTELNVFLDIPGYLPSTVDLMEVIYGEFTEYGRNGNITNTFIKTNVETFGSGNATAMDKLHWTRLIYFHVPQGGDTLVIDSTNLVVQAMTTKEKDLVWMERLRRSYVLQDEADI